MKFLAITIVTLSLAVPASANIDSRPENAIKFIDTAAAQAKLAGVTFAQRRGRKCQENLGYGRTGSYGCG